MSEITDAGIKAMIHKAAEYLSDMLSPRLPPAEGRNWGEARPVTYEDLKNVHLETLKILCVIEAAQREAREKS